MPQHGAASAKPAGGSSARAEAMDDGRFQTIAEELIGAASDYMDAEILLDTERSWRYFDGAVDARPMGFLGKDDQGEDIYEGSRVVVTECRDTLYQMIPELYRIFTSSEEAVAFDPKQPEDVEGAEQATHYANYVWSEVNEGEALLNTALLDWGVKFAAIKVWWEEVPERRTHRFDGLNELALKMLTDDAEVIDLEAEPRQVQAFVQQAVPDGGAVAVPVPQTLYSGKLVRETRRGKICIKLIPHEELIIDGDAQEMSECRIVGQQAYRPVEDVVAMGLDRDLVERFAESGSTSGEDDGTTIARTRESRLSHHGAVSDPALAYVRIVEANVRIDRDGDGQPEDYRVIALGQEPDVVDWEEGGDAIYIVGSPFETAHKIIGRGVVEVMTDLQDIGTALFRGTINNLNRSINPRAMVSDDDPRTWDDLNSWFGGPIRVSQAGAVEWYTVPFTAQNAFPLMEYVAARSAQRTGISPAGQGLDPNVLKGQTLEGVHAMVAAPQARIEYLARRFALSIMKPIFKAILRLSTQYQDQPSVVRLRNKWITVDPRHWNASMDASPKVGLGTGTRMERFAALQVIAAKQEQLLAAGSPLVTLEQYKNTLMEMFEIIGMRDVSKYIQDLEGEELQAAAAQAQQAAAAQVQQQMQMQIELEKAKAGVKAQVDVQKAQLTSQTDQQQAGMAAQLASQKMEMDTVVERLEHALAQQRLEFDHTLKLLRLEMENRLEDKRMRNQSRSGNADMRENA